MWFDTLLPSLNKNDMNNFREESKKVETCPVCSEIGKMDPQNLPKTEGKTHIVNFICPNNHRFSKSIDLK